MGQQQGDTQPPQTPPQRQRWRQGRQQNQQQPNQVETQRWFGIGGGGSGPRGNRQYFNQTQQQQRERWQRGRGDGGRRMGMGRGGTGMKTKERMDHAGVPMTGQISDCLICCQRSDLFGLGECMHPICMECALRIRVVGESRQCPQCRAEIPILNFVCAPPGQQLLLRLPTQTVPQPEHERKYGVLFESQYALDCFNAYMANRCGECTKRGKQCEFGAFAELRSHLAQAHELSYCHICCDNLNVLIKDRRVYTRDELQQHMNGKLPGEEDGFRGHPTCQFCEERFYDDEQQYRHLRKEHYFCQFCDQDGREQNVFYRNQHQLNKHNSRCHHPCTDTECLQMGICFRTDVELDVHKAKQHHRWLYQSGNAGGPGRSGAIPLDIQFSHTRGGIGTIGSRQNGPRTDIDENLAESEQSRQSQVVRIVPSAQSQQQSVQIIRPNLPNSLNSAAEFPSLPAPQPANLLPYGAPPGWTGPAAHQTRPILHLNRSSIALNSRDQFPSLGGGSAPSSTSRVLDHQPNNTIWGQKTTKELFAPRPEGETAKKLEETKRKKFIPSPDCWPEHMMEKMKAREEGRPDPDPIELPNWMNLPKKEKKRKSKTVPVASAASRLAAESAFDLVPSSSKFNTLAAYDEMNETLGARQSKTTNWWSGGHQPPSTRAQLKLTPSTDDPEFVRIELPIDQRRQQQQKIVEIGEQEKNNKLSIDPPPGFEFAALPPSFQQKQTSEKDNWELQDEKEDDDNNENESKTIEKGIVLQMQKSSSINLHSNESLPPGPSNNNNIIHLTMRSIASAIFGGGGGGDDANEKEDEQNDCQKEEQKT